MEKARIKLYFYVGQLGGKSPIPLITFPTGFSCLLLHQYKRRNQEVRKEKLIIDARFLGWEHGWAGWVGARPEEGIAPIALALRATQGYLGKDRRKRWRTGSWKGRHTLHLSLPQIGTCVPASRASTPICEPLRNNSATRPVPSRGRLQTAATKNSLLYGQWRAAAQGGPGAVFPAVKVTPAQPWASFPPNWGWGDLAPETGYPVSCSNNLYCLGSGQK